MNTNEDPAVAPVIKPQTAAIDTERKKAVEYLKNNTVQQFRDLESHRDNYTMFTTGTGPEDYRKWKEKKERDLQLEQETLLPEGDQVQKLKLAGIRRESPAGLFWGVTDNTSKEMRDALLNNPLKLVSRSERVKLRHYLGMAYATESELEEAVMKQVAVRYIANQGKINPAMVDAGWDEVTKQIFGEVKTGKEVYFYLRELQQKMDAEESFRKEQEKYKGRKIERAARSFWAGVNAAEQGLESLAALSTEGLAYLSAATYGSISWLWGEDMRDAATFRKFRKNSLLFRGADALYENAERYGKLAEYHMTAAGPSENGAVEDLQNALLYNMPQLLMVIATAELQAGRAAAMTGQVGKGITAANTASWGARYIGASAFATEYASTADDPNLTHFERCLNALAVGGAEMVFENLLGSGKLFRKYWLKPISGADAEKISTGIIANSMRTLKSLGKDAAGGAAEEVMTGLTQRLSALIVGKNGKELSKLTASDIAFELLGEAPMESAVGFTFNALMGAAGWKHRYRKGLYDAYQMNARAELIGEANAELKELEAKDDLTAEEVQRAEFLRNAVKQQNVEMLQLDRIKKWEEELQKYEEEHSELTESEWAQQQQRQGIQEAKTLQKGRMPVRETVPQAPVREQTGDQTVVEPAEQTPATENAGSSPEHIRRTMYQGFVRSVDEAVRELNLEGMSIELIETAAALPEHIRSKPGALRAEGAYDQQTGTVYLVAENLAPSRVRKVLLHEAVGHKGLHQIFGKRYGSFLEQIANDHADGVAAVASRRGLDLMDPAQRIEAADEFLAEMAETRGGEDVSVWKRIVAAVRGFFRRIGFHATWTDDEIADLFRQSRKTLKRNRAAKGEAARLAIFGEEGARRMENAVQLLENLSTAKQMTADGKDAKVIKLATGWELGGDGKWRMEMPDAVFTTRAKLPDGAEYDRTLWDVVNTTNGKLSEYVVADEIFEAYPELKDYHFQIVQMPYEVGGSFNPDTKTIYINQLGLTAALKMVDDAQARLSDETLTAAERKSAQHNVYLWTEQIFDQIDETLVHEVQHAIQRIEGFAPGSNVRHFIDHPEYDPKRLEKVTYYREKLEKAQKNLEKYPELKKMVDRYVELEDVLFSDDNVQVDEAAIDAEMDQIKAHFESIGKRELLMDYITGRDNYTMAKDAAEKHKLDPVESYRRTAGEVEARNVQERMDMTMEEHLNSLLSETEDVAEKDKIYLNGLVRGGSEMAADRPYYKIPFSEGLRDAVDPAKKNERSPVFITTTGSILQKLGFTALPMMMNRRHLRLNYYSKAEFERIYGRMRDEEHAHNLRLNLKEIVSDLEHPLAVVVNTRPTAKPGSVAVITDINVNGKKVVIPVLVSVESRADNNRIDAHLVLTVYDSKDWIGDFLKPAVEIEKSGKPGVFYTDPEKAGKYRVLRINKEQVPFGFTGHTIQDIGINVKSQSETLQFKSWFGDSKVVDENGKPLEVYHGTNWDGWEFDTENGAFFSEKEDYAEEMAAQRGGSRTVKAYLSIRNPLVVKVPGNKMADPAFEARIIAEAKSKGHDGVKLETDTNNEIEKDVFWVAFEPNQIKSATDNVGTFDPGNPDVRFSVAPDDAFVQAWAKVLLPVVSTQYINVDGAAAYLMDHGIEVYAGRDDDTLRKACVLAQTWKKERNKVVRGNREHKALEKKDPYYKILSGKFGRDFQINAGPKYDGTVFTGTWMDKHKTEKGRSGSITAAEAAKILTESTGKEVTEAVVVEHFGHLKRETLLQEYREKRRKKNELWEIEQELLEEERQQTTGDIPLGDVPMPQETQAMEEARKRFVKERAKADQAEYGKWVSENMGQLYQWAEEFCGPVINIRPSYRFIGEEFTGDFISKAFRKYSENRPGKKTGKKLIEYNEIRENSLKNADGKHSDELATEIANKYGGDALEIEQQLIDFFRHLKRNDIKQMYREAKRAEREIEKDYAREGDAVMAAESFQQLLEAAESDRVNVIQLQQMAVKYARLNLPEEMRGKFLKEIADLSKWTSKPSPQYPQGRRVYELEKLMTRIQNYRTVERIRELLNGKKVRLNSKGIPIDALTGEVGESLARIRAIVALPFYDVENKIAHLREQIKQAEEAKESTESLREELLYYDLFGRLDHLDKTRALEALRIVRDKIDGNRESLLAKLQEKLAETQRLRYQVLQETTGEKIPRTGRSLKEPPRVFKPPVQHLALRELLSRITVKSGLDFDDTVAGKLYRKLEESTQKQETLNREDTEAMQKKLEEVFHITNLRQKAKLYKELEAVPEHTGILVNRYVHEQVYYVDEFDVEHTALHDKRALKKAKISVSSARKLLQKADAGDAQGFDPLALEFLRQQLSDFDLGIEQTYHLFGNEDENDAWNILHAPNAKDREAETKLLLIQIDPNEPRRTEELNVSKAEAANILMAWEQPDLQLRMKWNGWSEESIDQLKKYIGPELLEWAYWSRDQIKAKSAQLDQTARKIYGAGLPGLENYYPTSYKESAGKRLGSTGADGIIGDSYGQLSISPDFLIARKFHLSEPDFRRSILSNYLRHTLEVNHFLAMGETVRQFRDIFNNSAVRFAIVNHYGEETYNQIMDRVKVMADDGRDLGNAVEMIGKFFKFWIPSKIALNSSSVLKQMAGVTSYMNDVPIKDFIKYFWESLTGSKEFKRFSEYAVNSDFVKNRIAGGMERDIHFLMRGARNGNHQDVIGNWLVDKGTFPTRWADKISTVRGGYAAFRYHYEKARARGMSEQEAWDHGIMRFERATRETQQSGYLIDQNYFQSNAGMYRYLTAFLSNPIQVMALELETIYEVRHGKGERKEAAKKKLWRQIFVNHVIVGGLMVLITQFLRNGFDWDEYEFSDYVSSMTLGPFEGTLIFGKLTKNLLDEVTSRAFHEKRRGWMNSTFSAFPILDDLTRAYPRFAKLFDTEDPPTGDEIYRSIQSLSDVLMAAGSVTPVPGLGASAGMTGSVLREGKRFWRLFFGGDDKEKKPKAEKKPEKKPTGYRGY